MDTMPVRRKSEIIKGEIRGIRKIRVQKKLKAINLGQQPDYLKDFLLAINPNPTAIRTINPIRM